MFRSALLFLAIGLVFLICLIWFLWKILGLLLGKKPIGLGQFPPELKSELDKDPTTLAPWDGESLSLLSLILSKNPSKTILGRIRCGQLATIYQEPLAVWAMRGEMSDGGLLVRANGRDFSYRLRANEVNVQIDGQAFGSIVGVLLLDTRERAARQVGRLENERDLFLKDRRIATLVHPADTKRVTPKALDGLVKELNEEETDWLMAVVFWHILKNT